MTSYPTPIPRPHSSGHRWLARVMGLAAFVAGTAILLRDAISTGHWGIDQLLMPIVLIIAIGFGLLTEHLWREGKVIRAAWFAVLFLFATGVASYNSIGRQTEGSEARAGAAEAHNTVLADKQAQLAESRQRLTDANEEVDKCMAIVRGKLTCSPAATRDWQRRAKEVQAYILQLEGDLAALGGQETPYAKAGKVADLLSLFGVDHDLAQKVAITVEPFAQALLLELATIFTTSFGFGGGSPIVARAPQPLPPAPKAAPQPLPVDAELEQISRYLLDLLREGGSIESVTALAKASGVNKSTICRASQRLEADKKLLRKRVGRRVELVAV